jgi:hypothetical protein
LQPTPLSRKEQPLRRRHRFSLSGPQPRYRPGYVEPRERVRARALATLLATVAASAEPP